MTKEYLLSKAFNENNMIMGKKLIKLEDLDKFFESTICIPKGKNRHPYADELHQWVEGAEIQYLREGTWRWEHSPSHFWKELRIKPSEPVYEWQWYYVSDGLKVYTKERHTELEA
jgi:hypothetical protein